MTDPQMPAPERLVVPTCIGCGAMGQFGTCATGCSERKLELVRAAAYDELARLTADAPVRADAFQEVVARLAADQAAGDDSEFGYRSVQDAARTALRAHPSGDREDLNPERPAEHATTWWCPECGGIDAPQPCLGICVWRPVEWVKRTHYEQLRADAVRGFERERSLRQLLRRVAYVTPHPGRWEQSWKALQREATDVLERQGTGAADRLPIR